MSDTKLMSYAEIATALAIGGNSARALVRRKRWQRKPGNDGLARIEVPVEYLAEHEKQRADSAPSSGPADSPAEGGAVDEAVTLTLTLMALTDHVETLKGMLTKAGQERDEARRELISAQADAACAPALRTTVEALKQALSTEKDRTSELRDRLSARRSWWPFRRAG
jgi:predicted RNase H-like nuclease (RuvC/YqgF family)